MKAQIMVKMQTDKEGDSANSVHICVLDLIKQQNNSSLEDGVWALYSGRMNELYVQLF